uniref:Uncharacterized protein n=1 Tax=Oryza nivara TaxID=4536 RepID=A0A0E0IST4_ORYNI
MPPRLPIVGRRIWPTRRGSGHRGLSPDRWPLPPPPPPHRQPPDPAIVASPPTAGRFLLRHRTVNRGSRHRDLSPD